MSNHDKKLLIYLGAAIILACAYFFAVKPFGDKTEQFVTKTADLKTQYQKIKDDYNKTDYYTQEIVKYQTATQELLSLFPADISQEHSILFISSTEEEVPMWLNQVRFEQNVSDIDSVDSDAGTQEENTEAAEASTEQADTTVQSDETASALMQGLSGTRSDLTLEYEVSYDGFKKFLDYINHYDERMVIRELTAEYDTDTGKVTGTVKLSEYALSGEGRTEEETEIPDINIGTSNVFQSGYSSTSISETGTETDDAAVNEAADFFLKVNAATDNTDGKVIGRSQDSDGETYISSNANKSEIVTFTVEGSEGEYEASYEMAGEQYNNEEFTAEDQIVFKVISSVRTDSGDKVEVELKLVNKADIPLLVTIQNDDPNSPRVSVRDITGDVVLNQ